jgi:hypothetical protein
MASKYRVGDHIRLKFQEHEAIGIVQRVTSPYTSGNYYYDVKWIDTNGRIPWTNFGEGSAVGKGTELHTIDLDPTTYEID